MPIKREWVVTIFINLYVWKECKFIHAWKIHIALQLAVYEEWHLYLLMIYINERNHFSNLLFSKNRTLRLFSIFLPSGLLHLLCILRIQKWFLISLNIFTSSKFYAYMSIKCKYNKRRFWQYKKFTSKTIAQFILHFA